MIPGDFHNLLKQRYKICYFILISSTQDVWVELALSTIRGLFDIVYLTDKNGMKFAWNVLKIFKKHLEMLEIVEQ